MGYSVIVHCTLHVEEIEHAHGPTMLCGSVVRAGEDVIFNVWGRKIRHGEECPEVLIDDFYLVRKDIVLGPFPTHLGGTRLGWTRFTGHPAFMDKSSTT